jgi:RNA polymerase sigma-70 factor (ECF subfamily)
MTSTLPDDAIATLVAEGDDLHGFAELLSRHEGAVYGLVWRRLRHAANAADVCQDVFLRCWNALRSRKYQPREGTTFSAWLMQIARRTVIDSLRSRRYVPLDEAPEQQVELALSAPAAVVREGIRKLPREQREIVELELDGFTQEEMADLFDVPRRRIVYLKGLAVAALKRFCERHLGDRDDAA